MNKSDAKKRIDSLKKIINYHRYQYHVLDKQEISEPALDSLKKELFDFEQKFPELITPDSPTQRVGGEALREFKKVEHKKRMASLNDAFSEQDIRDWLERLENYLKISIQTGFYCDPKMDGLALELVYENGILKTGSTRGDGLIGEDVTENVKTIEAIPLRLGKEVYAVIRGEAFLNKKEFENINKAQRKKHEKEYANPRNVAAGSIRQLDPRIVASRNLDFFAYSLVGDENISKSYKKLNELGFKTNPFGRRLKSLGDVFKFYKDLEKKREKLGYEIDGIVVTVDDNNIYEKAGIVGKAPRASIAYKFPAAEKTSIVKSIIVQVGRTGALTPVAELEPVQLSGVIVRHATLHNYDEIQRLGLKIGDTVIVSRAGDVIPKITKVLEELRTGKEKVFHMPTTCPYDNQKVIKDGVIYRCPNPECGARHRENLYHFVSRAAFNIEGFGPKIVDRFLDEGLIVDQADIFSLEEDQIKGLERFGEKSAENLIQEIKEKKIITLPRFIFSLGIHHVGEETAILLAKEIGRVAFPRDILKNIQKFSQEKLEQIPDIGPKVAESILSWFKEQRNIDLLNKLEKVDVRIKVEKVQSKLSGKTFVITGTLDSMSREQAKERIHKLGGKTSSSVSSKINYVLAGENPGLKIKKAQELGIKVLSEKEFLEL